MASTQGSYKLQSLVERDVAFEWDEAPGIGEHINWDSSAAKKIGAVNQTGDTVTLRRPGRIKTTLSDLSEDTSLPDTTQPGVGYSKMVDASLPLTVNFKVEANLNASMKELTLSLTKEDAMQRFIRPAIVDAKDQMNVKVAQIVAQYAGQTLLPDTSTYTNYHQQVINVLGRAEALMVQRKGMSMSTAKKIALTHMDVYPKLAPGASTVFHAGRSPESMQSGGTFTGQELAGFQLYRSPVLDSVNVPATNANVKVAAPGGAVTNGLTTWAQTWSCNIKGLSNSTTYPAGLKIALTGVNWLMPTTASSTGKQVTFTLVSAATSDGSGNATFVLSEPLVYSGDYKNVDIATAVPTDTVVSFVGSSVGASIVSPCYAFDPTAIVGVSPKIAIPDGVSYSQRFQARNGFNFALIEDRWPGTLQSVVKLVGFFGVAVPKPEGVSVIYGL